MPVSRHRKKKKTPCTVKGFSTHNSLVAFYGAAAERNLIAFKRELQRQVIKRENLADIKAGLLSFTRAAELFGDLTDWMQTAPEAAWVTRDDGEEELCTPVADLQLTR